MGVSPAQLVSSVTLAPTNRNKGEGRGEGKLEVGRNFEDVPDVLENIGRLAVLRVNESFGLRVAVRA